MLFEGCRLRGLPATAPKGVSCRSGITGIGTGMYLVPVVTVHPYEKSYINLRVLYLCAVFSFRCVFPLLAEG